MRKYRFAKSSANLKIGVAVLGITFALAGCKKKEAPVQVMPPAPVVLVKADQKDTFRFIDSVGSTTAFKSVTIVPQVSGQILSINFKQGDIVKEGDILAVIDKRPYEAQVLAAHADLMQAQAKLKIDSLAVERNKKLADSQYVDKQTYDSLVATVESDKGAVEAAQASLDLAKINLDWCTIKAPVSGKVGLYNIDMGNVVAAGTSAITTVEQLDRLYVDFIIPTHRLHEVQTLMKARGGKLEVEVAYLEKGYTDKTRKAEVSVFENKSRYQSSTTVLRGEIDNKDGLFAASQPVKARLNMEEVKNGVFIPDSAMQTDKVGPYIYIADKLDDMVYRTRKVYINALQQYADGKYLVEGAKGIDGKDYVVKGGEMIVSTGQLRVAEGAYAYASIPQGAPIGADGKPITNPQEVQKFMQEATQAKARYEAEAQAQAAPKGEPAQEAPKAEEKK